MKNLARKTSCHKECARKIAIAIAASELQQQQQQQQQQWQPRHQQ